MSRHLAAVIALVDTAETRPLTAEEAARLRTVLRGYDQARRQLGAILAARAAQQPPAATCVQTPQRNRPETARNGA